MSTLLIVNPTPAVQRRLTFDAITPDGVNRTLQAEILPSGKGMNCARAAAMLGTRPELLLFLGQEPGQWFSRLAQEEGQKIRAVTTASPTRTCSTLLEQRNGSVTELVETAAPVTAAETDSFLQEFASAADGCDPVILIGTVPPGAGDDLYARLMQLVPGRRVLLDTQGAPLLAALPSRPWLVKPNRQELAAATGRDCGSEEGLRSAIGHLHALGARNVLVTDGPRAAWLSDGTGLTALMPPVVEARNPIGSGDSVAAGLAVALSRGATLGEAARLGLICGSANAAGEGYGRLNRQVLERA